MRLAVAVDIGATTTKLGIVADDGTVRSRATVPTGAGGDPEPLVERIGVALAPILDALDSGRGEIAGAGVAVAGFLDHAHEVMVANANLPTLCGFPLRRALEDRLGMRCVLEVDSNASTLAEYHYGAGRGATRLLGVTIGTGFGGGIIVDGRLLRFTGECAGDIGHIILDADGRPCPCGARGCLEALVSSSALSQRAGGRPVREIIAAAQRGDPSAREALVATGEWLGLGLASLAPVFAPDRIVVGGGVAAAGELLLAAARASFRNHGAPELVAQATIVASTFGGWEGMLGAATLLFGPPNDRDAS